MSQACRRPVMLVSSVPASTPCGMLVARLAILLAGLLIGTLSGSPAGWLTVSPVAADEFPIPQIPWQPRGYVCQRTPEPIEIDGALEEAWDRAAWTEPFVDIEGSLKPLPYLNTRAKMLWDDDYFYVAAFLEQPHVWATLRKRDSVIYHDDDFEVFIDPNGDTHEYHELEVNALGTEWDLLLLKPYRDGAPAVDAWDIQGLQTGVAIHGTLNDPGDRDEGWSIEIAFPWDVLEECAHRPVPPDDGDLWRVNFSRVEWRKDVIGDAYVKAKDPATGRAFPEHNWVWSPQGLIAMHYPEMWGYVEFRATDPPETASPETTPSPMDPSAASPSAMASPATALAPSPPEQDHYAFCLRQVYYKQKNHHARHGVYATRLEDLTAEAPAIPNWERLLADLTLVATPDTYVIMLEATEETDGAEGTEATEGLEATEALEGWTHFVREDGRAWRRPSTATPAQR